MKSTAIFLAGMTFGWSIDYALEGRTGLFVFHLVLCCMNLWLAGLAPEKKP